jgi:hypothetical protein
MEAFKKSFWLECDLGVELSGTIDIVFVELKTLDFGTAKILITNTKMEVGF